MKKLVSLIAIILLFISCGLFHHGNKNGCPVNVRNMGAEKLLPGYDSKHPNGVNKGG